MIIAAAVFVTALAADLARLRSSGHLMIGGDRICSERSVIEFYARRDDRLAWSPASTASLLRAINRADDDGLRPGDYHLAALQTATNDVARDLLATDAFLLLAQHLAQGRVDPQRLVREWCMPARRTDLATVLQTALDSGDIEGFLQKVAPQHTAYVRLRIALAFYRDIERGGGWQTVSIGRPLRAGDSNLRVTELRHRLAREPIGIEPRSFAVIGTASPLFDAQVEAIVRHFQAHHALVADGVVGSATLRELNVPASERVGQIALNMERWRWMPERLGDSYALVNIAAFRLAVIENGRSVLTMKTVVGKSFWETPFFPATIDEIVLNPSWFVPDNIADEEIWPKQRRDRSYLRRNHFEILRNGRVRQLPGPWNPLGQIKFNLPNRFSVYLHDTTSKALFDLESRAFSHGCIRLERASDLALYLLRGQPEWNLATLNAAIGQGKESVIHLAHPEPVYVLYWTAWAGDDGHIEFHRDVYKRDAQLSQALRSPVTSGP